MKLIVVVIHSKYMLSSDKALKNHNPLVTSDNASTKNVNKVIANFYDYI